MCPLQFSTQQFLLSVCYASSTVPASRDYATEGSKIQTLWPYGASSPEKQEYTEGVVVISEEKCKWEFS